PWILVQEILIINISRHIKVLPVIHTGPPQRLLTELEAERFDQVQPCARSDTCSSDISRVRRDLRLEKYNIQHLPSPLLFSAAQTLDESVHPAQRFLQLFQRISIGNPQIAF